jgi:hypothetical protein
MGADGPKVMARPQRITGVTDGLHDILGDGMPLRRAKPNDLLIAHQHLSTRSRFVRKVNNICASFCSDGVDLFEGKGTWQNQPIAWHWRRWAALAIEGKINEEFDRNVLDADLVVELRRRGVIKSAREILAQGAISHWKA